MPDDKITVRDLKKCHQKGKKIIALTAYDALMARMIDEAGAEIILVGDSLGMVMLGYRNTIPVTLEHCLHHTAAVSRVVKRAFVVGDMPFLTYQTGDDRALRNAGRFLQEAGADAVKLEGGREVVTTVKRLVDSGIPVLGHIGILPQHVPAEGTYRVQGRNPEEAEELLADALALQNAGAFGIVLEGVQLDVAQRITESLEIPTIGIGAGPYCSGQIQVTHDILGLFEEFVPKHTRRYATLAETARKALSTYIRDVEAGEFPGAAESFE